MSKRYRNLTFVVIVWGLLLSPYLSASAQVPGSPNSLSNNVYWLQGAHDDVSKVGDFYVKQYKNAGTGGMDWTIFGTGAQGGDGVGQLWLFDSPNRAIVTFSEKSSAVAFLMSGDHNDGYAEFIVDGKSSGVFDLYELGKKTLVVSGLPFDYHTIQVVHLAKEHPKADGDHVAILGGAALTNREPDSPENAKIETQVSFEKDKVYFTEKNWSEFKHGKNKWLIKREGEKVIALYNSPNEIGRAEGKLNKGALVLKYSNAYQDQKKYPSKKDFQDSGTLNCNLVAKDFICRSKKGRMNFGLEFLLERQDPK